MPDPEFALPCLHTPGPGLPEEWGSNRGASRGRSDRPGLGVCKRPQPLPRWTLSLQRASAPRTNVGREPGRALFISKFRVWNSDWPIYYASPAWDTEIQDQSDWVPALVELTVRNGEERNRHKQKDFQASTCYNGRAGGRLGSGREGSAQAGQVMSGGCPWQACSSALPARYLESHNHLHGRNWPHVTGQELGDLPKDTELANAGARFELRAS